ncbi:MAG: TerB family tellurite resistance protein [Hyphomicrobium aestuarii]|nr:TerB family tellurite resistance protein [Hyphomicrobium aestuarii]
MPYRSSLGRISKQTWDDFNHEIKQAQHEHLLEGIVAGCALVAYADGWVTDEEHDRMVNLIRGFEPIAVFGLDDVMATFETMTSWFASDQTSGEAAALEAVARVKGSAKYSALLIKTCCAIAAADGGFDAEERHAITRICQRLGLDPATFDMSDAP